MLRAFQRASVALLVVLAVGCAHTPGQAWHRSVTAIAAGQDSAARVRAITDRLDALEIPWTRHLFTGPKGQDGTNIIADLGGTGEVLLIGAHHDRVAAGIGATDNASGSAAVLELAATLKQRPLANHHVKLAFWDLEEQGLLGSAAWVAEHPEGAELYVNFDVFGWGDTLWVMAPDGATSISHAVQAATTAAGLAVSIGTQYPPTDHLPFLKAERPAVSFSLVDASEIKGILAMYAGEKLAAAPKVMQVIHTDKDQMDQLDTPDVKRALPVVLEALRRWDLDHAAH
jgi:aminopeptidase S